MTNGNILVTGGCGFIGSVFIRYALEQTGFKGRIVNIDALTYAGNPANLSDVEETFPERYVFIKGDIRDRDTVKKVFDEYQIGSVVHFAAESHVDRSIEGPGEFVTTNIVGTFNLLEIVREFWENNKESKFHHVSTDEVFGSLGEEGSFNEETPYDPRSPYSASKAASDHLVRSYFHTYGLPITISNCSNNYGPWQFPEKLIPLMILNMKQGKPLPVYGDGSNIRDWLYVEDHAAAIWLILEKGINGRTYTVGGGNEWQNIRLVKRLCELTAEAEGVSPEQYLNLIQYVTDRPGHDQRYAIDSSRIETELGWRNQTDFDAGLVKTIDWYKNNQPWIDSITSGDYRHWITRQYGKND